MTYYEQPLQFVNSYNIKLAYPRMYLQAQVLQWLKSLDINQIKHFLTIKNTTNSYYIKRILTYQPQCKPIDRISHGYSETKVNNEKSFYQREKYRYKKKKQQKMALDKILFQNITVSRLNPWAFSLKKSFIKSKQFQSCMLLFSDEQLFNYSDMKQKPVKLGNEKQLKSIWFDPAHIRSFSQWLVYLFQMELFQAFQLHRSTKVAFTLELNHFTFVAENIKRQNIKHYIQNTLHILSERRFNGRYAKKSGKKEIFFSKEEEEDDQTTTLQVSVEQVPYLLNRCLEKFQDKDRNIDEVVFQYEWFSEDRKSKVNRVLKDICRLIARKFKDFQIDTKAAEIQALGESNKKKKKRGNKKNNGENQSSKKINSEEKPQKSTQEQDIGQIQVVPLKQKKQETRKIVHQEIKLNTELKDSSNEDTNARTHEENQSEIINIQKPLIQQKIEPLLSNKAKKSGKTKSNSKAMKEQPQSKNEVIQSEKQKVIKSPKITIDQQKQDLKKSRRIVNQRINQHILFYYQQLSLSSQAIDKYRKICIEVIESTINEMNLKIKWELILFGSYSVDFALRQSDLDLVVVVEDTEACSLHSLYQHFKVKQWLRECNIIQIQSAKVPILQFQILLSCIKHPKLKDGKRLPKDIIHVDITMTHKKQAHQGIRNTTIMRNIFQQNPNLKTVGLIFKELLKIYDLNKPFKGGIGSYVLVILLNNILHIQQVQMDEDFVHQIALICDYMTEKFEPYKTLISPYKNTILKANPKLQLNVQDLQDNVLLNTTKIRQINEIIILLRQFRGLLDDISSALLKVNVEERKKMKRIFFQKWNIVFKPHEEMLEFQK